MSPVPKASSSAGPKFTYPVVVDESSFPADPEVNDVNEAPLPEGPAPEFTYPVVVVVDESSLPADPEVSDVNEAPLLESPHVTSPAVNEASFLEGPAPEFTYPVVVDESSLPADPEVISDVNEAPLLESPDVTSLAVNEASFPEGPAVTIPVIDASLFMSTDRSIRAKAVRDHDKACEEWGSFMLVNHGIPAILIDPLLAACEEFSDLSEEEKRRLGQTENPKFPTKIMSATDTNPATGNTLYRRSYVKFFTHPELSCPGEPKQLRELASEYSKKIRVLTRTLLGGISEFLGLEQEYIDRTMEMNLAAQIFAVNSYPPWSPNPDPKSAIGITNHTEEGLLTFLIQNGVTGGHNIVHGEKWVHVNPLPGSILVNVGDNLTVVSNGRCKTAWHRALVSYNKKMISVAVMNGPAPDIVVAPAPPLVGKWTLYDTTKYYAEDSSARYELHLAMLWTECNYRVDRGLHHRSSARTGGGDQH